MSAISFEKFMEEVDKHIRNYCGLTSEDFPDIDMYWRWKDQWSPHEVAAELIETENFLFEGEN